MCCTLILQRSSLIMKGMMHAATSRRSRIRNGPSTRTRGDSAHLLLHCDAEGLGNNGAVDTGHDERGGQGKGSRGDNPTADCRTTTAKEMLTCVKVCRHLPAYDRHGKEPRSRPVFASRGQIAYKLKKAQNGEPYLRLPCGIHSDGHAAQARNAQTEVNQACPPRLRVGTAPQGRAPRPHGKTKA